MKQNLVGRVKQEKKDWKKKKSGYLSN
jgi:hypothetical protein